MCPRKYQHTEITDKKHRMRQSRIFILGSKFPKTQFINKDELIWYWDEGMAN